MRLIAYLDEQTINLIDSIRTPFLNKFFILITYFGANYVILFITTIVTIFLAIRGRNRYIFMLWIAFAGSIMSSYILKLAVHRPRPLDGIIRETLFSFPSAHAVLSLFFYGFIMHLLLRFGKNKQVKSLGLVALSIFIILIGFSRLYLGVHFLSDVMAGYLLGGLWLLIGIKFLKSKNSK